MRIGRITRTLGVLALAAGAAAAAQEAAEETGGPREKCFGVARAGENGGIGLGDDAARSRVDYQGDAWTNVPRGTCQTMALPAQADGTPAGARSGPSTATRRRADIYPPRPARPGRSRPRAPRRARP